MEHEGDGDTSYNRCARYSTKILVRGQEELEIGRRAETIQVFLRSAKIPRKVLENRGDMLSLKLQ